jgi:hypothetical protein
MIKAATLMSDGLRTYEVLQMANMFIRQQCANMIRTVEIFHQACEMAALRDDGKISKDEKDAFKAICKASNKFIHVLEVIVTEGPAEGYNEGSAAECQSKK